MSTLNFTAAMNGSYSCTAGNGAGNFTSENNVQLVVTGVFMHASQLVCGCSGGRA